MPRWLKVATTFFLGILIAAYGRWHLPPLCESDQCGNYRKVYWLIVLAGVLLAAVGLFLGATEAFFGDEEEVKKRGGY